MRKRFLPHTANRVAACVLCALAALIFQGCEKDAPNPYAELDAKFPQGRPGVADVSERAQDAAYMAELQAGSRAFADLQGKAGVAKEAAEKFEKTVAEALTRRMGKAPSAEILAAELAKNDHYQGLLKEQRASAATAEAQRQANLKTLRDRMWAGASEYDALRAAADAKAKAEGVPVRDAPAPVTPEAAAQAGRTAVRMPGGAAPVAPVKRSAPTTAALSVEDLSKATGIPVTPAKP